MKHRERRTILTGGDDSLLVFDLDPIEIPSLGTEVTAPPGTVIGQRGRHAREFVVVRSGALVIGADQRLTAGDWYGDRSLLTGEPLDATAVADGDVALVVLDPREFSTLVFNFPVVRDRLVSHGV